MGEGKQHHQKLERDNAVWRGLPDSNSDLSISMAHSNIMEVGDKKKSSFSPANMPCSATASVPKWLKQLDARGKMS